MELTKTVKDKTFDDYFTEVDHSESISEDRPGSMRLFYLNVRSGKIKIADLEKFTMLNIGRCSRLSVLCVNVVQLMPREPETSSVRL